MINFFRRIRQSLLNDNKYRKYILYAIGEIALVMIGILLALQVNNWNESQKAKKQKNQLVLDLLDELNHTSSQIDSTMILAETKIDVCEKYFSYLSMNNDSVVRDSLVSLLDLILRGAPYALELPSYEQAKSTGKLSLLDSKEVITGYSNLLTNAQSFKLHRTIGTEIWYKGPSWEMRSKVGGKSVLTTREGGLPRNLRLSDKEYIRFLTEPHTYATIENSCSINRQMNQYLKRMSAASKELIKLLESK